MNKIIRISILIKIITIISGIYGIIRTYFSPLTFTYWTTLSNIFVIVVTFIFLVKDYYYLNNKKIDFSSKLYIIKFLSVISITLTFIVYLTLLAPVMEGGIIHSYLANGAGGLFVHFVTPLLSVLDFFLFDTEYKPSSIHAIYAIIPALVYVLFVVIASSLGLRWGTMKAPYNFLNYGAPTGWFGFDLKQFGWESLGIGVFYMIIILSVIFILIGLLFLWLRNNINNRRKGAK